MQKGQVLIFLLIGILIIAAAGGAYYLGRQTTSKPSPTPVVTPQPIQDASPIPTGTGETANWKIYTNTTYRFSFKYPATWIESTVHPYRLSCPKCHEPEVVLKVPPSPDCVKYGCGGGFHGSHVDVLSNPNSLPIQDYINQPYSKDSHPIAGHFIKNDSSLGISDDWVIDRHTPGAGSGQSVVILHRKMAIELYCGGCNDQLTDQIISTFKFTQ